MNRSLHLNDSFGRQRRLSRVSKKIRKQKYFLGTAFDRSLDFPSVKANVSYDFVSLMYENKGFDHLYQSEEQ